MLFYFRFPFLGVAALGFWEETGFAFFWLGTFPWAWGFPEGFFTWAGALGPFRSGALGAVP